MGRIVANCTAMWHRSLIDACQIQMGIGGFWIAEESLNGPSCTMAVRYGHGLRDGDRMANATR